jgi:hypothetical protein
MEVNFSLIWSRPAATLDWEFRTGNLCSFAFMHCCTFGLWITLTCCVIMSSRKPNAACSVTSSLVMVSFLLFVGVLVSIGIVAEQFSALALLNSSYCFCCSHALVSLLACHNGIIFYLFEATGCSSIIFFPIDSPFWHNSAQLPKGF